MRRVLLCAALCTVGCDDSIRVPVNLKDNSIENRALVVEALAMWDLEVDFTRSRRAVHVDVVPGPLECIAGRTGSENGCERNFWVRPHPNLMAHEFGHIFWEKHGDALMAAEPDWDALPTEEQIDDVHRRARRYEFGCN